MKPRQGKFAISALAALSSLLLSASGWALEPQTLFNFQLGLGPVRGALIEGPDGNFYGTTAGGGPMANGTVFRVTPAGVLTILVSDQPSPAAGLVVGNDGLLYGMTHTGGAFVKGTVFKVTTSGILTNFAVFDGTNGANPTFGLVLAGDGNFYGSTSAGGAHAGGTVFRVTPDGIVTTLVSFDLSAIGGAPAGLTLGRDGNLYGSTTLGGSAGHGTIFKMTTGGALTTLYSFESTDGTGGQARLAVGPDGNLYGTTPDGGSANIGTIFRITTNGIFTTLLSFTGTNGAKPRAELSLGADGQLYGTTQLGGSADLGTVFKVTTNGALTTLVSFNDPANGSPQAGLLLATDGNFYGCSQGAVFRMTPDGALSNLVTLLPLSGIRPQAGLVVGPDGNFYGTTRNGGSNSAGTIFRFTPRGVFTSLFSFNDTNGFSPQAGLALGQDGNFYGTTVFGGANGSGTIFRFSTNGTLTTLASFNGNNGANPQCQLAMDASGNFYGTTPEGGAPNSLGTVFRVTTNGVLTTLVSFEDGNGVQLPLAGLTAGSDGNFYGTTSTGGPMANGGVFRVTPGGVLTTLVSFNGTNGSTPLGGLVQANDGNFYGTTAFGGTNSSFGTIFKVTTNGDLKTLFNFHFTDGEAPSASLIFGNDGNLYGTTQFGGVTGGNPAGNGLGTVFRITTNGIFTSLILFQRTNGSNPQAPLVLGNDGNLYGTTTQGGTGGGGTIFRVLLNDTTPTNSPPSVAITSPTNGSSFIGAATITLQAAASDSDGSVTNIQFFDGVTSLGNVSSSPYNLSLILEVGSHALIAIASDNLGATTVSSPVMVTVTGNSPPTVAITSPTNGTSIIGPATTIIQAAASDSDGSVTNVQFFDGVTVLGNVSSSPYNLSVPLEVGSHALIAIASDNLGATTASLPVMVTVTGNSPPTVAITSPTNGSSFIGPATIAIQAAASDSDGSVTNVQFFDGDIALGNVSSSPYNLSVTLLEGLHPLIAVATDNLGATTASLVTVTITTNSPPTVTPIVISGTTRLPNGSFQFAFTNTPGISFTVLTTTNLAVPVDEWTSAGAAVESSTGHYQFTDATPSSPQRFYCVRSP